MKLFAERALQRFSHEQLQELGWLERPIDRAMRLQLASLDFEYFCRYYLSDHFSLPPAVFQETLMRDAEEMAGREEETYAMAIVFRGGAKTTIYALALPLWCLLFGRRHFIIILSDTEAMAKDKCLDIKNQLEDNPRILEDFGLLRGRRWADLEFETTNGCKVVGAGSGVNIRGRRYKQHRPDLVILDDIENRDEVRSPTQREALEKWLLRDVFKCGGMDTKFVMIGTYLSYDCVLREVNDLPIFWRRRNFPVIPKIDGHFSFATQEDLWEQWKEIRTNLANANREEDSLTFYKQHESAMLEGAASAWPERFSYLDLMVKRLAGTAAFNTEMLNEPNDPSTQFFHFSTFRKIWDDDALWLVPWDSDKGRPSGRPRVKQSDCILYAATDPSMGESTTSAFSAIIIIARAPTGQKFVLEAEIERRTPDQIIQDQVRWFKEYPQIMRWSIERNQMQAFFASQAGHVSLLETSGIPLVDTPPASTNKDLRIQSIQPDLENGYVLIGEDGQFRLKEQLTHYPHTTYVDGPDALQMAIVISNDPTTDDSSGGMGMSTHRFSGPGVTQELTGEQMTIESLNRDRVERRGDQNRREILSSYGRVQQDEPEPQMGSFPILF